ncbi:MAG: TRAP transporter large permease [Spirochaetales bacterium]|jgi:tripartite ATP-independent transporter DctM subunit|nr:TRAP transporter large permease [Spirochaetales bacterium]
MTILGIFFLSFVIFMILRMPLYLCLIASSSVYIFINPDISMMTAMGKMMNAPNSFTLLAVPFFIFAGQVMNLGGVSNRIFGFANVLVGHLRGGLAYVNVLASMIFAGGSGSALADVGGLGLIEMKAMKEQGYEDDIILGVTGASATVGPIIPPSIPFVVYGAMANVSIGGLFLGGIGPGVLIGLALCLFIFIIARKRQYVSRKRATLREIGKSFTGAFAALMFPVIIIGGIWVGLFTPTEAAFVSAVYGIIISRFVYRDFKFKDTMNLIRETVYMVGPAISVVVGAALFAWIMTYEKVDKVIVQALFSISTNKYVVLLLINLLLLFLGMFIEVVAAIMLMLPILMPIIAVIDVNPIHLGVIMVLNMMIGLMTPPVGFSLYMLSTASKISFGQTVKYCFPWTIPLLIALALVTYFEPVVMFLPRLMGMA